VLEIVRDPRILAPVPPVTQTECPAARRLFRSPLVLALVVTAADAAKPVVVDDAAYLIFARHIAARPLDPYGFTIFWYTVPDPAFEVLAPPVLPYWLALGVRLFGEHVALLKLSLLPFVWLLAWAADALLRRFARDTTLLPVIVLSPAVLPAVNLMLDVPALALGLTAVEFIARAAGRNSWPLAVAAGLVAALAMQTKYTMLLVPPVLLWYGIIHRRVRLAAVAALVAVGAFAGWEFALVAKYGRSHFAFHAGDQPGGGGPLPDRLAGFIQDKADLTPGLTGHFGCLGVGVGIVGLAALGVGRRWLAAGTALWAIGFAVVALAPGRWTGPVVHVYWQVFGLAFLAGVVGCALVLVVRRRRGLRVRTNRVGLFLAGWVAIELAGYFALTPFPAARRVIGLTVVSGILVARVAGRVARLDRNRALPGWVVVAGVAAGVAVTAIDTLDAYPEKDCAERAAALASGPTVWFQGHWGFQFYCERAGMRPVIPGQSALAPGDTLVVPVHPNDEGFFRPHVGRVRLRPGADIAEVVAEVVWEDRLAAQTVPNFYGGINPVVGREHPRLRVLVYRVVKAWTPPGP
jgi:hypothetical protein